MGAFLVGVVVGLLLPWLVAGARDLVRGRQDGPENIVGQARKAWGRGAIHK